MTSQNLCLVEYKDRPIPYKIKTIKIQTWNWSTVFKRMLRPLKGLDLMCP